MNKPAFKHAALNELSELVKYLDPDNDDHIKLIKGSRAVLSFGDSPRGTRHREQIAPDLIKKIKKIVGSYQQA